jgi:endonuclease-3
MRKNVLRVKGTQGIPFPPREILDRLIRVYGPLTWKQRRDPVSELVATILSQHTSDLNAERAFEQLINTFGSLDRVAEADIQLIALSIHSGGLSRQKAPRIKNALNWIIQTRGTLNLDFLCELSLSDAKSWLTAIPGVGPKTAAVVLCFSLGMPAFPVDTHVHRVTKRLGLIGHNVTADCAHDLLEQMLEPGDVYGLHVCLITHGRMVCKALRPMCESCVLADGCPTGRHRLGNLNVYPKV